jgi:hypothetical protein
MKAVRFSQFGGPGGLCVAGNTECTWFIATSVGSTSVELTWNGGPEMNRVYGGVTTSAPAPRSRSADRNLIAFEHGNSLEPTYRDSLGRFLATARTLA